MTPPTDTTAAKRLDEVAVIYEIGQAINTLDLDAALRLITEKASQLMDAQACSLLLKDPQTDQLALKASYGLSDDIVKGARVRYGEGIAGKVAQSGEPMLILDVANDPRFAGEPIAPRPDVVASLCVPLKNEIGDIIGVLSIRRHEPAPPFTQADLKLFCIFANQAGLAINNAELYARLNSRVQQMATIADLLQAISSTLDLDGVLSQIADSILEVVGLDRCCVYLRDPRKGDFTAGIVRGFDDTDAPEQRVALGEGVVGMAAKEKIPIFLQNPGGMPTDSAGDSQEGQSALALPVVVRDSCIGVVLVDNQTSGKTIGQESIELLSTFVNQAGIAIENARLYEAMEQKYAELNVLYEQSRAIGSAYGLENAAQLLMDVALKAVDCDSGAVVLLDERRQQMRAQYSTGFGEREAEDLEKAAASADAAEAVRKLRDPVILTPEQWSARPEMAPLKSAFTDRSCAVIPLIAEDATIGVQLLARSTGQPFQNSEMKLLSIIVSHAAVVLKNAIRYEERMREKTLELSALYDFSTKISSAASLEEALDSIVAIVSGLVQCDECIIYVLDQERGLASPKATWYRRKANRTTLDEPLDGSGVVSWVIRERKAVISPNALDDPRFNSVLSPQSSALVMSLMSIPLMMQDEIVGILNVHSYSPSQYTEDDVRVLSIIASQSAAIYKELEALSALTSYTDNILSSIAAGVVTLDSAGSILTWNKAANVIVGLSDEQVVGRYYTEVVQDLRVTEANKRGVAQAIGSVLETGQTYQAYKMCFTAPDGRTTYLNLSASQLVNSGGERLGLVIIFEDVTREIGLEDQFRRMSELAAIGQLAASIAHELRNPLSSIKGAAQYLQKEYEEHSSIVEFLSIIIDEVNGLNKLTTEFLDFARPIQLELKPLDLNTVVEKTVQLMGLHIAESSVALKQYLVDDLPQVEADEDQIGQALKNIIINAVQAMPQGGELTVETKPAPGRGGAELWVRDTGVGISPEKLDRIFVPFFTTKTKGTGLGLAVVRKIVENHGGRCVVHSEANLGTNFGIILPLRGVAPIIIPEADSAERRESRVSPT